MQGVGADDGEPASGASQGSGSGNGSGPSKNETSASAGTAVEVEVQQPRDRSGDRDVGVPADGRESGRGVVGQRLGVDTTEKMTVPLTWKFVAPTAPARSNASSSCGRVGLWLRRCPRLRLRKKATAAVTGR